MLHTTCPTNPAIYARISQDKAGEALGVERQVYECQALLTQMGWAGSPIVFSDNDLSATSGKARPGYQALLSAIADGKVDALAIWHPDRLHRLPRELEPFIDLVERQGTKIATVSAGTYDLTTPAGRMVARIIGATARYEGEQKAQRQRAQIEQAARAGKPPRHGKVRTFGYAWDMASEVAPEADALRHCAREILAGTSISAMVHWINAEGFVTTEGNHFKLSALKRLLLSERVAGYRTYEGQRYEGNWPAILDRATHEALVEHFDAFSVKWTPRATTLLSGIARCGLCGTPLVSGAKGYRTTQGTKRARIYTCRKSAANDGCNKVSIRQGALNDHLGALVIDQAGVGVTHGLEAAGRLAALEQAFYVDGTLSRERFDQLAGALRPKVADAALEALLVGIERTPEGIGAKWDEGDLTWQRSLVSCLVDSLIVNPAPSAGRVCKVAQRIELAWR